MLQDQEIQSNLARPGWFERIFSHPLGRTLFFGFSILSILGVSSAFLVSFFPLSLAESSLAELPGDEPLAKAQAEGNPNGFVVPTVGSQDPGMAILNRVRQGDYEYRVEVSTGRFLDDFDQQWSLLEYVDMQEAQAVRRRQGWILVEAPYSPPSYAKSRSSTRTARMRLVEKDGDWKLEHIRLIK